MTDPILKGLNWGHRRATAPLDAASAAFAEAGGGAIAWQVQPLSGFESGLGPALADRYDLIVFDHPFCGSVVRDSLFMPLDDILGNLADADFVGRSLESYRYGGHLWALPVDGATQVALYRPDLLAVDPPGDWRGVLDLGRKVRSEGRWLGLAGLDPHGFLMLAALCANLGGPMREEAERPFDPAILTQGLDHLDALWAFCHPDGLGFNAIDLHEAMSRRDDIVCCPAVYGYLTYAEADRDRPLRFADFPGPRAPHAAGSVLGGTGLGITRSCRDFARARAFVSFLADARRQTALIAGHHGQPSMLAAWCDAASDTRMGGAFSGTLESMRTASMRPRFAGYIGFQHAAGSAVARYLAGDVDRSALIERLEVDWRRHRAG